jgi:hypothetical protein
VSRAVAVDLDGTLGDTRPLWNDWPAHASGVLVIVARELSPIAAKPPRNSMRQEPATGGCSSNALPKIAPVYLRPYAETRRAASTPAQGRSTGCSPSVAIRSSLGREATSSASVIRRPPGRRRRPRH